MAWPARRRSVALIALIAVLLPALAILQYRWLGELSGLEQLRAQANIRAATARFSQEFDAHLAGVYTTLSGAGKETGSDLGRTAFQTAIGSLTPAGLVKQLYLIERGATGAFTVRELDAAGREVGISPWPAFLGQPAVPSADEHANASLPTGLGRTLLDEVPAIVVRQLHDGREQWTVAVLSLDRIVNDLLPAILAGCFEGGIPVDYDVLVVRDDMPDEIVYRSRQGLSRADFDPSLTPMPVFAIHGRDLEVGAAQGLMPDAAAHRWRLVVQPKRGALEAAVGAARFRNVAIGIGVLALLAVSVVLLIFSMHSMQRAAREQLELVARISHELRTPLATITCAGENLADNLVETPADTRHYGQLIKREGRRLTKTLGDILLCCRLQARPDAVLNLQPTDVAGVIDRALADTAIVAAGDGVRIEKSIEPKLPLVLADSEALRMALKNLLINAITYGNGHPVRISAKARRTTAGHDVSIVVEDQGPGIPSDEITHIFEPFYRGRTARNLEIEGSGIGLSIVRQVVRSHGGRIRVSSPGEEGTRFTLQLPALRSSATIPVDPAA
jgi:signal transduction histidine kinase